MCVKDRRVDFHNHIRAGIKCGVRGKSAGLKCRDFGAGQKCEVMCKVQGYSVA